MTTHKELLILRHGKSDWNSDTTDFNRPLNHRGKRNAQQMGEWIVEQKLVPELIISSPALRAISTAKIVGKSLGLSEQLVQTEKSIYEASLANLQQVLSTIPDSIQRLLLVGHNPGFEYLVSYLAPNIPRPDDGNLMPTATLAYLQLDQNWASLPGECFIQRPKDLP